MLDLPDKKINTNVYIDGANLKKGIEFLDREINYKKLYDWLRKKYRVKKVYLFLGYIKKLDVFYGELTDMGYSIIFKETFFEDSILKGNCDAELILNCIKDFYENEYDNAILISGDGDFSCLVKFLEERKSLCRVIAPNIKRCSVFLKRSTNKIVYMEKMLDIISDIKEKAPSEGAPVLGSFS